MKHEYFLVGFFLLVTAIKVIPVLASTDSEADLFLTFIDINSYTYNDPTNNQELGFGIK